MPFMVSRPYFARSALTLLLAAVAFAAGAQDFPTKPVRIIVPYTAGGVVDGLARVLSIGMKDALGQPVVVENRVGAGGVVGMQACGSAPADGYTLCFTVQDSLSYNPYFLSSLPYDAENGFTPITNLGWTNGLIVANAKSGITSYQGMVAAAKANPGKLNWGTWGEASQPDIQLRAVAAHNGINITPIPYKSAAQANPAFFAGEVDIVYLGIGTALQHIAAGTVKPLWLTGTQRNPQVPGVPTLAEMGVDVGLPNYMAAFAPAKVPGPIVEKLHAALVKASQTPGAQQFYKNFTMTFVGDTPAAFADFVKKDRANAARVFQKMGFKQGSGSS